MKLVPPTDLILVSRAEPVCFPAPLLSRTTSEMLQIMLANRGCGLAAPQVGISLRVFTYKVGSSMGVIVNPEINSRSPEEVEYQEGCLTFPDKLFRTKRAKWVSVTYQDMTGERTTTRRFDGFMAIVFQHEFDHLEGRLVSQHGIECP